MQAAVVMMITSRLWKSGANVEALENFGSNYAVDTHALQINMSTVIPSAPSVGF